MGRAYVSSEAFQQRRQVQRGKVKTDNQMDSGEVSEQEEGLGNTVPRGGWQGEGTSLEGYIQSKVHPGRGAERQLHTDIRILGGCGPSDKEDKGSSLHSFPTKNTQNSPFLPLGLRFPYEQLGRHTGTASAYVCV